MCQILEPDDETCSVCWSLFEIPSIDSDAFPMLYFGALPMARPRSSMAASVAMAAISTPKTNAAWSQSFSPMVGGCWGQLETEDVVVALPCQLCHSAPH